jgi:hypothetical protein
MLRMWYAVHDYVRLLLTKTPENNLDSRKKKFRGNPHGYHVRV